MSVKIHFLNVGQGDCTIVEFISGRIAMIDIDNLDCLDPTTEKEISDEYSAEGARYGFYQSLRPPLAEFRKQRYATLTDPLIYYTNTIGTKPIFRMIITHPDMDHMSGLHRIHVQEPNISITNFWHTGQNNFEMDESDWYDCPYDERDWTTYKQLRDGSSPKSFTSSAAILPNTGRTTESRFGRRPHPWRNSPLNGARKTSSA